MTKSLLSKAVFGLTQCVLVHSAVVSPEVGVQQKYKVDCKSENEFENDAINRATMMLETFPMHCVRIEDLLEFEKLPSHAEVQRMNKFVIPDRCDTREILFISHQWT